MKKIITAVALLLATATAYSQGFYLDLGLGYAFPQAGQTMYDSPIPYNGFPTGYNGSRTNTATTQTYSIKGASFSAGMQGVIGIGYMVTDHVGIQMNGSIGLAPRKYTFTDEHVMLNTNVGPLPVSIVTTQKANTPVMLMPSLVLQTGGNNALNIYTRFGVALPLNTKITQHQLITNDPGTGLQVTDDYEWQVKNSFSLGFTAAAGVRYKINDRVSIWGEVNILSMSVLIKEQDLKSITETDPNNGSQSIPPSSSSYSKVKFSKTASLDSTFSSEPTYAQPFSNVGINVGVTFNLSNQRHHSRNSRFNSDEDVESSKPYRRR